MSEQTVRDVQDLLKQAQELLNAACRRKKFGLKVAGHTTDDDWINIVVTPTKEGVGAYEYTEILSKVENEIRAHGDEHVLLVPARAD